MLVKQISVFLENQKGRLAAATALLGRAGIDLVALNVADTTDFGIMRCIVTQPEQALALLRENGFMASMTDVLAVEVSDEPGGLNKVLELMDDNGINVEYLHSFVRTPKHNALIIFRVENNEKCIALLKKHHIRLVDGDQVSQTGRN